VPNVVTWNQARQLAEKNGGRLPTSSDLRAAGVHENRDTWMPAINSNGHSNVWVQIARYSYHTPSYGPPRWGTHSWSGSCRPRPNGPPNYMYIMVPRKAQPGY
jgi:hypothetical protein